MKTQCFAKYILISSLMAILLYSCVYSVHPLFTEQDLVSRDELVGSWTDQHENIWIFEEGSGHFYDVIHIDEADTTRLEAGLGKLGDLYFLDFTIGDIEKLHDMEVFHLFPTHTFSKVTFDKSGIVLEWFATEWLEKLIKEKRIRIKHELVNDQVLLTASTIELQKFIQKYANEPKAFDDPRKLTPITAE